MSGAVGAYNVKKVDLKAWGPHDTAPEWIPERVCTFHGPPKYAAKLLVDIFRRYRGEGDATPWRYPSSRNALSSYCCLDEREMGKALDTSRFFFFLTFETGY